MKNIAFLIWASLSISVTYAQNVDWVNAPVNPVPKGADLKYVNLKGDVLQANILDYYTKDGKWFDFDGMKEIRKDAQGRVTQYTDTYGTYAYTYDTKGNLVATTSNGKKYRSYTYDSKNRLVKTNYELDISRVKSDTYSYTTQGNTCIVTRIQTNNKGETDEEEIHYTNGIKTYSHFKGYPATLYTYEFDEKGNWISRLQLDAATKKTRISEYDNKPLDPYLRHIIYHSEYNNGVSPFTVTLEDAAGGLGPRPVPVPHLFINGTKFKRQLFSRFIYDYVFYDALSKTYYIARNAYSKTNTVGQQIPVETLITGEENILLYNGEKIKVLERADSGKEISDWSVKDYRKSLGSFTAYNAGKDKGYVFENMPTTTDGKVVAIAGKPLPGLQFVSTIGKKNAFLFKNGDYLKGKYEVDGFIEGSKTYDLVVSIDNTQRYVLTDYNNTVEKRFYRARLFDPNKDVLKSANKNVVPEKSKTEDSNLPKTNEVNNTLSPEANAFLSAYHNNNNIKEVAKYVTEMGKTLEAKNYTNGAQHKRFLEILTEVYTQNQFAAYDMMMVVDKKTLQHCLDNMPKTMREYFRKEARKRLKK